MAGRPRIIGDIAVTRGCCTVEPHLHSIKIKLRRRSAKRPTKTAPEDI